MVHVMARKYGICNVTDSSLSEMPYAGKYKNYIITQNGLKEKAFLDFTNKKPGGFR